MALQLRMTGETLRITGDPAGSAAFLATQPADVLLATEAGEPILTDTGEPVAVEPAHAQ
jgi:hypothetical protein